MARLFSIHYRTAENERVIFLKKTSKDDEMQFHETMESGESVHTFIDDVCEAMWYRYAIITVDGLLQERHDRYVAAGDDADILDQWRSPESQSDAFRAEAFASAIFPVQKKTKPLPQFRANTVTIVLNEPRIEEGEAFCIVSKQIIGWNTDKAIVMKPYNDFNWVVELEKTPLLKEFEFKFGIWDTENRRFKRFEDGLNRQINIKSGSGAEAYTYNEFGYEKLWRYAGVAVPVFSLRTTKSRGCGEFSDIKALADWCEKAKLRVIQLLPINDTTATFQWADSYPYNAISIMALHPNYISVGEVYSYYGKNISAIERETGLYLNDMPLSDYNRTREWKRTNLRSLFDSKFPEIIADKRLQEYLKRSAWWVKNYAAFAMLRDKFQTPNFRLWAECSTYSAKAVEKYFSPSSAEYADVMFRVFVQYHLELQLKSAIDYAHEKNIAIKGDLPIGINPNSVEAWVEPELFNFGLQAGAPPDYFSRDGQNWGFPVYNWDVMAGDGYKWWQSRLGRMQEFFDAFRIDHILGMFRIWSIPSPFKSGIMGIFSPALPLSSEEIARRGFTLDPAQCSRPTFNRHLLSEIFGEMSDKITRDLFNDLGNDDMQLKAEYFSPAKIGEWVEVNVPKTIRDRIRSGFNRVVHDVLFVSVRPGEWHPRIMLTETEMFRRLSHENQNVIRAIHDDYFYNRHNEFWREMGTMHLDSILKSCNMLVCGEDLGMIPDSVPAVMQRTQILSLELQRMPKFNWDRYGQCSGYQYMSVSATSSHDISNIRGWWEENFGETQWFYNHVLHRVGEAPRVATEAVVSEVVQMHLNAPSMLSINPIQDYAGMLDHVPHLLPREERINEPSDPNNMWRYRVPFCLDTLAQQYPELHQKVRRAVERSER